ncbi:ParB/RepB/Spo0J family partition protein [Micromonospora sp. NPDC050397]|uniref:ParB/RepB/Spo0J family partition protein n=1 Tax=Micromonospora sp. NPDC050397 TaxID=3364279 RepID=UPI00384F7D6F
MLADSEDPLPPILVHRATMRVIDGMHRLYAARLRGESMIDVQFFDGTEDEAFITAVQANASHGLPLTRTDREAATARIIAARPGLSDRSIASITGLAGPTVGRIRRRMGVDGRDAGTRTGQDGRVRPLNSADARRVASKVIAERPGASLREVAEIAGISPATVRDVRERVRRGDDPVPTGQRTGRGKLSKSRQRAGSLAASSGPGELDLNGRDLTTLLQNLSKDPSLRYTESGRALLRTLFSGASGPKGCHDLMDGIPTHSAYLVATVARACAQEWLEFAARLENQIQESA